ncbi:MAG: Flp pilus assembly complex ATPase component TadA [Proteobacteria bacterium]|nr:Flp pilus assembly complex ATPase component TadA [Pseudomonadota bacterium]
MSNVQLEEALRVGKRTKERIGKVIVNLGYATEEDIANGLGIQFGIPSIMLSTMIIDPDVMKLIPETTARKYNLVPISLEDGVLKIAMLDPIDVVAIDEIKKITGYHIEPLVSTETEIAKSISQDYGMEGSFEEMVSKAAENADVELAPGEETADKLEKIAGETSVVQLVNMMVSRAAMDGVSDIHIEPDEDTLRVRFRVDGMLIESANLQMKMHPAVISRLKVLADLDIAEKRLPQDGRFVVKVASRDIDVRLSTLPTIFGEKVVMRLLDKGKMILDIDRLTPVPETLAALKKVVKRPHGMILVTGPTGSGKTTTAYTLLSLLNTMDKNLVTVEDPVEYHIKRVNQVHVNPKVGITFASALRHILRQDPDVVLIGEIRDKETAEIAIHAALTGHIVISTIHTNDAIGTVSRLLNMGIEPYLVSSSLSCIVGQRLVKKLCESCKEEYEPDPQLLMELGVRFTEGKVPKFFKEVGCKTCKGTGFKGRIGIYEVLLPDDKVRASVVALHDSAVLTDIAKKQGFKPMRIQGVKTAMAGETTLEEVLNATQVFE